MTTSDSNPSDTPLAHAAAENGAGIQCPAGSTPSDCCKKPDACTRCEDDADRFHCNPQSGLMYERSEIDDSDRRTRGRLTLETLSCSLGRVLDLSGGGMRIEAKKKLTGDVNIELLDWDERVTIRTHVAWLKRCGLFRYEIGLQFMNLDPKMAGKLSSMAMRHRYNRAM